MSTKSEKLSSKKKPTKDSSTYVSDAIKTASSGMPRQYTGHAAGQAYYATLSEMSSGVSGGHGQIFAGEAKNRKEISKKFR